jgi:hypothetical protein
MIIYVLFLTSEVAENKQVYFVWLPVFKNSICNLLLFKNHQKKSMHSFTATHLSLVITQCNLWVTSGVSDTSKLFTKSKISSAS